MLSAELQAITPYHAGARRKFSVSAHGVRLTDAEIASVNTRPRPLHRRTAGKGHIVCFGLACRMGVCPARADG
jgi:hypothetical protein